MPPPQPFTRRLQTTVFSIEDLLDRVRRGEIRVPEFQRAFQWGAKDISDLIDSVYRGFPIGALLFWRRDAPAARVYFGPVAVDAPQTAQALWLVDGHQRLTALAGVLLHPPYVPGGALDEFALFFDLQTQVLVQPKDQAQPAAHWIPLNLLIDSKLLLEWLDRYPGRHDHPDHLRAAMELSKAIREFQIPTSIIEADTAAEFSTVFERLNSKGKSLTQADLSKARAGQSGTRTQRPRTLGDLSKRLRSLGFGKIDQEVLHKSLVAVIGNGTISHNSHQKNVSPRQDELDLTERALRSAIIFLRREAGIQHFELLPYKATLIVVARFFHLHPEPSARSRELLSRWLWRGTLTKAHGRLENNQEALEDSVLRAITVEEERSIRNLLALVPHEAKYVFEPLRKFAFKSVEGKILTNALISLHPRDLRTSLPLNIPAVLEREGTAALPHIVPLEFIDNWSSWQDRSLGINALSDSICNIIFHPQLKQGVIAAAFLAYPRLGLEVLHSHGVSQEALEALERRELNSFLLARADFLEEFVHRFQAAKAHWGESDRGSLQSLIVADEED